MALERDQKLKEILSTSFQSVKIDIQQLKEQVAQLQFENRQLRKKIQDLERGPSKPLPISQGKYDQEPSDRLKEDLLRNYQRNRKHIVKQQILGEANKSPSTKMELRDIVVAQKKYCSKASFYRYVEELELEGLIEHKRINKKTIICPLLPDQKINPLS